MQNICLPACPVLLWLDEVQGEGQAGDVAISLCNLWTALAHTLKTLLCAAATLAGGQKAGQKFLLPNLMDDKTQKKKHVACCTRAAT